MHLPLSISTEIITLCSIFCTNLWTCLQKSCQQFTVLSAANKSKNIFIFWNMFGIMFLSSNTCTYLIVLIQMSLFSKLVLCLYTFKMRTHLYILKNIIIILSYLVLIITWISVFSDSEHTLQCTLEYLNLITEWRVIA